LHKSMQAQKRTELKYQTLFRNCPDMIIVSQRDTARLLEVNDAFERLMGYHRDEVVGRSALLMNFWEHPESRAQVLAQMGDSGRLTGYETRFRRKDGEVLSVLMSVE